MVKESPYKSDVDAEIVEFNSKWKYQPEKWVEGAIRWGEENTFIEMSEGPREWQLECLEQYGFWLRKLRDDNRALERAGKEIRTPTYKLGISAGRGPGKTALDCLLAYFFVNTRPGSTWKVMANNEDQLTKVFFGELKQWAEVSIMKHWWHFNTTEMRPQEWVSVLYREARSLDSTKWGIQGQLWSMDKVDAARGMHNHYGMGYSFEEASGIPAVIIENAVTTMTDKTDKMILMVSQDSNLSSYFYRAMQGRIGDWNTLRLDNRKVKELDQEFIKQEELLHGEDSDYFRVNFRGMPPKADEDQLIKADIVEEACQRSYVEGLTNVYDRLPIIAGLDVGGGGKDPTVLCFRRGNDATIGFFEFTDDAATTIQKIMQILNRYKPMKVFYDKTGVGYHIGPSISASGYSSMMEGIHFGGKATKHDIYHNKRVECWCEMEKWLRKDGIIPDLTKLKNELCIPSLKKAVQGGRLLLQSKSEMDKSPDYGDALALTFAGQVIDFKQNTGYDKNTVKKTSYIERSMSRLRGV